MISWAAKQYDDRTIDIRVDAAPPWNRLSPDYQQGGIPVPGITGMRADCVTGIMEGLKLIGRVGQAGKINPGYFSGPGRPRSLGFGEWFLGYSLAGQRIDWWEAREKILIPAYRWVLHNRCHELVLKLRTMGRDQEIWIYDGIPNRQIDNPDPFSCAAVLVAFLNESLKSLSTTPN